MRAWWRRLVALVQRARLDREIDEELALHAQWKAEALEARGVPRDEARAVAQRQVGNALLLRERARDAWAIPPLDTFAQDVRHAGRLLLRHRAYAIPALATLALGIGLNTAIFSIVYGVLLKPLPYRDPGALVVVLSGRATDGSPTPPSWTAPDYQALREDRSALADIAAFTGGEFTSGAAALTGHGAALQVQTAEVTPNFFDLLGVTLARGRTFDYAQTAAAGAHELHVATHDVQSVVISDALWRTAFNANPSILGTSIIVGDAPRTVIGVLPPGFVFRTSTFRLANVDVWIPNDYTGGNRNNAFLQVIGRRQPRVSVAQADAVTDNAAKRIEDARWPLSATVVSLHEHIVGPVRRLILVFAAAVAFVLLIACLNVANLQIARLAARRSELAVRAALGAGRRRIARQLITESVILALAGGALGVALAYGLLHALTAILPAGQLPRTGEITLNLPVLAFCLTLSLAAGVLSGSLPAWRMADADPHDLRAGALRATSSRAALRTRAVLVAMQVALTLILIIGATLLARTFVSLAMVDPGFQADQVVTASMWLPEARYPTAERLHQFSAQLRDRLRALPADVQAASAVNFAPFGAQFFITGDFRAEGQPAPAFNVAKLKSESRYLSTIGIPLREGRDFTDRDDAGAPAVAIVGADVARRLWPGASAIGKRVSMDDTTWRTVVGVAADIRQNVLHEPPVPTIYVPYQQEPGPVFLRPLTVMVRTSTPEAAMTGIRQAVAALDPDLPLMSVSTMRAALAETVAEPRFRATVLAGFALSALAIATVGIYGLLAYTIAQRRREIGVRLALGAAPSHIVWLVVARVLVPVGGGLAAGLVLARGTVGVLQSFLFGVRASDAATMAGAAMLLVLVALAAAWLPARRAARVDPLETLRSE